MSTSGLLDINDLRVEFKVYGGVLKVLDGVNFYVNAGEKVGLVGEEGEAYTELNPTGRVRIGSEYWNADAEDPPIEAGTRVEVTAGDRLRLKVRRKG